MPARRRIRVSEIRRLLESKHWTQADLAKESGVQLRTIQDILKRGTASHDSIKMLAEAFKVEASSLLSQPSSKSVVPRLFRLTCNSEFCFGRNAEIEVLNTAWQDSHTNVLVITSDGGYGKTTLVMHWLASLIGRKKNGAEGIYGYSFSAQGIETSTASESEFLDTALKLWFQEQISPDLSHEARGERLAELIRSRRALLILDGLETLQRPTGRGNHDLPSGVRKLLVDLAMPSGNQFLCIITSRVPLSDLSLWQGRSVHYVELGKLSEDAGVELLTKLNVVGEHDELKATVREWQGHPLNLTWLGTRLQAFGGDIRKRRAVTGGSTDYHTDRLFEYSESRLTERERAFLRVLAFFDQSASWTEIMSLIKRPEISGVTDSLQDLRESTWSELLNNLMKERLVSVCGESRVKQTIDFYHPLARTYYQRKVLDLPTAWAEGNRKLFLHYRGESNHLAASEKDFIRLNRAVAHGCDAGLFREVFSEVIWGQFCRGFAGFKAHHFGLVSEDQELVRRFFPLPENPDPIEKITTTFTQQELGQLNYWAGMVAHSTGSPLEAILRNTVAADLFTKIGDRQGEAFATGYLSRHHMLAGNIPKALEHSAECLRIIQTHFPKDHPPLEAALGVHAMTLHVGGQWEKAQQAFDQMWAVTASDQSLFPDLGALNQAYYCEYLLDRHQLLGEELRGTEIESRVDSIHSPSLPRFLAELARGRCYLLAGELEKARLCIDPAVEYLRNVRNTEFVVTAFLARARLNRQLGHFDSVRQDVEEALLRSTVDGLRLSQVDCQIESAALCLASRKRAEAAQHLESAKSLAEDCGYARGLSILEKLAR